MSKVSSEWLKIAARMIDARSAQCDGSSSPEHVRAMAFIFDEGIFFLGNEGMAEVKKMLLDKYEEATP